MKGFNLTSWHTTETAIQYCREIESFDCNFVRYQLIPVGDIEGIQRILTTRDWYRDFLVAAVDKAVFIAKTLAESNSKIKLIVDLHAVFGGIISNGTSPLHACIYNADAFAYWIEDLRYLCEKLEGVPNILAIEPINEPAIRSGRQSWKDWTSVIKTISPILESITSHKIVIPCYGSMPVGMARLPKLNPRRHIATCHFWPPHMTLVGVNDIKAEPKHYTAIDRDRFLEAFKDPIRYKTRFNVPVLIGEIGCARAIGDETQKKFLRKTLKHCIENGLGVAVHDYEPDPTWGYRESGAMETIRKVFQK